MALPNSYKLLLRMAAALLLLASLGAQTAGHMSVGQLQKVAGKRGAVVQAKIPCAIDAGFHVNSSTPSEDYLIPLKLTWMATGALQAGEVKYPQATQEKYPFAEKPLSVVTGKFDILANFTVAANAPAGPGMAAGKLRYQACNDRACFPPKTIEVSIPYSVTQ